LQTCNLLGAHEFTIVHSKKSTLGTLWHRWYPDWICWGRIEEEKERCWIFK